MVVAVATRPPPAVTVALEAAVRVVLRAAIQPCAVTCLVRWMQPSC